MRRKYIIFTFLLMVLTACAKEKKEPGPVCVDQVFPEFHTYSSDGSTRKSHRLTCSDGCVRFESLDEANAINETLCQ